MIIPPLLFHYTEFCTRVTKVSSRIHPYQFFDLTFSRIHNSHLTQLFCGLVSSDWQYVKLCKACTNSLYISWWVCVLLEMRGLTTKHTIGNNCLNWPEVELWFCAEFICSGGAERRS